VEILGIVVVCVVLIKFKNTVYQAAHQHCTLAVFCGKEVGILWGWNICIEMIDFKRLVEGTEQKHVGFIFDWLIAAALVAVDTPAIFTRY